MDTPNYLALAVKPIDVATPLMQATKIRQSQMETQAADIQMKRDAIGAEARGLAPLVGTPEFEQAHAAAGERLAQAGVLDSPQAVNGWQSQASTPLGLKSLIARSNPPDLAFRQEEATRAQANTDRQFKEGVRQFDIQRNEPAVPSGFQRGPAGLQPIPGGPQDPEFQRRQAEVLDKPIVTKPGDTIVHPQTGKITYKSESTMSEGAKEMTARQIINGDLSGLTNLGKGAQGNELLAQIKNKAADILMNENGMTAAEAAGHLGEKLKSFKASQVGQSAEERTRGTREANLNLILKATEAAIPAALEASDAVERYAGRFVPLNQIIQKGQVMTSDANLRKFGMANLQLAEHWARAMNPTGVMRESDRDLALGFLSTADSKDTYRQVVGQLKTQITRERDAVRAGNAGTAAVVPGNDRPEISEARTAIAKGAPREAVEKRLKEKGITYKPADLDLQ